MSLPRLLRWAVALAIVFFVMKQMHISPLDLWRAGTGKLENFKEDTVNLTSGQAISQTSQKAAAEAQKMQDANPAGNNEMSKELQAERARVMEAKFNALQNPNLLPTEKGKLSEQVVKSAQQAGGGN